MHQNWNGGKTPFHVCISRRVVHLHPKGQWSQAANKQEVFNAGVTLVDWYTANDELLANGMPFSCPPNIKQWQVSRNTRTGILSARFVLPFRQLKFLTKGPLIGKRLGGWLPNPNSNRDPTRKHRENARERRAARVGKGREKEETFPLRLWVRLSNGH
jgi:hypothetical protein